ncbi:permease for cytosine/purines, uracil, thiamine, allantoin-domain-containing protein [Suillus subluteus]|nr:permease for cytosine/purines, uracil, thiamine, allantoin-domain-containing protein [Suillus subluteus]
MQSESKERKQGESHSSSMTPDMASDKPVGNDLEGNRYHTGFLRRTTQLLSRYGIETHGIAPVPAEERLETRWYQMFFVWFSANMNILTFSTGTAGPAYFSLGVNDSLIIIVIVDLVTCLLPAFFAVFGPKLGTRAMVQARFSWGYFGAIIPTVLNVFSMQGFLILNCIVGGQILASLSSHLNDTLGIVIIGIITLVVRKYRMDPKSPVSQATVAEVISFASILASSVLSWCTMTPDYGVYHSPAASSARIFLYTYLAFFTASVTAHTLGAAFAAAAPNVPAWNAGFDDSSSVGGLLYSVLLPTGAFGKLLVALVALSTPSACAPTMYTFSTSFMAVAPWFAYSAEMGIYSHL